MLLELRKPFLIMAFLTCVLSLFLQLGTSSFLNNSDTQQLTSVVNGLSDQAIAAFPELENVQRQYSPSSSDNESKTDKPPGLGISYLALIEMLIVFSLGLMVLSLMIGPNLQGRLQAIAVPIFSLFIIFMAITMILKAIAQLTIMFSLFAAIPFGTLIYLGLYGSFNTGLSQATLGILLVLKFALFFLLIAAHQRFIQNKGLMRLLILSLVTIFITTLLHTIVPSIIVSMTDAVAALITAILALIMASIFLIFSIPGLIKILPFK